MITPKTPLLLNLIFSVVLILSYIAIPSFSCPIHQKQSLLHFKSTLTTIFNSNSDPNSHSFVPFVELDSWNVSSDCCSWERVGCSVDKNRTVTRLHLRNVVPQILDRGVVLSDILTPIFHIRSLKRLDISSNYFHGEIPGDGFGNLTNLIHLVMNDNRFNGSIPRQFCSLAYLRELDMRSNLLEGELGPELGLLHNLNMLRLSGNLFHGPIPPQLFDLTSLRLLELSKNMLGGVLSPAIGKLRNLQVLWLDDNNLSGNIPKEIGNLTKLFDFSIRKNQFSGGMPSVLVNLTNLESIDFSENSLMMNIPEDIGRLSNLYELYLSDNRFTGPIPSSIRNMSILQVLWLKNNMLSGEIPTSIFNIDFLSSLHVGGIGDRLVWNHKAKIVPKCHLQEISMPFCGIFGPIPKWISSQKELEFLDLSGNQLEGRIPDWLAERNLSLIFLSDNNLTGSVPPRLFISLSLVILDLSRNKFSGMLPENIGDAKGLNILLLSRNNFFGQIPMSISKINRLLLLDLSFNGLSGHTLPNFGDNNFLDFIDISYNNFSGKIPTNLPKSIRSLYLGGNKFSDNLLWNFTRLVNLQILDLHNNYVIGKLQHILPQITTLEILILRNTSLEGFIPKDISMLSSLRILDLSRNNLTGRIPPEISNLPGMYNIPHMSVTDYDELRASFPTSSNDFIHLIVNWKRSFQGLGRHNLDIYTMLDLSDNKISGDIPTSFGSLKGLKVLNISHNMISGHIPVSFGNLGSIESLDLSHNEISGSIPQSLAKLVQIEVLDVSNNRLRGKIPRGGQMDTMNELNYFQNNSGLCGMQIKIICPEDILLPSEGRHEENEQHQLTFWEGTWVGFPIGFFSAILITGYYVNILQLFNFW